MVLNYPSNPCAACEAPGTFEAAVAWAHERGSWLLNDLAYAFLAFDGRRARSVLEVDGAREVAVELWSPSKVYGMAGWRVGFAVGNAEIVGRIRVLLDHLHAGVPVALQLGLVAALSGDQGHVAERFEVYRRRRDVLVDGLGLQAPEGTFYAWWRLPDGLTPERLLEHERVAVAPGEGFGARGAGYARLSLAVDDDDLAEGVARLAACGVVRAMKLLTVRYARERGQDDPDQAAQLLQAAERISSLPGLVWKVWIHEDAEHAAGGLYLFDTEDHARAWGDDMLHESLGHMPGVSDIETRYYDVDERLSAITRGPVAVAAA